MANMTGRKDLGVYRVAAKAIPKQSKTPTKVGDGKSTGKKMKKAMKSAGMLEDC